MSAKLEAYNVKIASGTDSLFDPRLAAKQGKLLAKMTTGPRLMRALKMATSDNAELLALQRPAQPFPARAARRDQGRTVCRYSDW